MQQHHYRDICEEIQKNITIPFKQKTLCTLTFLPKNYYIIICTETPLCYHFNRNTITRPFYKNDIITLPFETPSPFEQKNVVHCICIETSLPCHLYENTITLPFAQKNSLSRYHLYRKTLYFHPSQTCFQKRMSSICCMQTNTRDFKVGISPSVFKRR